MERVKLIAVTPLKYGGTFYAKGDRFDASRQDAKALKFIKRAADAPAADQPPVPPATPPVVDDPAIYRTADLVAESDASLVTPADRSRSVETIGPAALPLTTTGVPSKRVYKRRDMTPKP